jgi:hypothetical protein
VNQLTHARLIYLLVALALIASFLAKYHFVGSSGGPLVT